MARTGRPSIGVTTKVCLPKDVLVEVRALAAHRGESVSAVMRVALKQYLARQRKSGRVA